TLWIDARRRARGGDPSWPTGAGATGSSASLRTGPPFAAKRRSEPAASARWWPTATAAPRLVPMPTTSSPPAPTTSRTSSGCAGSIISRRPAATHTTIAARRSRLRRLESRSGSDIRKYTPAPANHSSIRGRNEVIPMAKVTGPVPEAVKRRRNKDDLAPVPQGTRRGITVHKPQPSPHWRMDIRNYFSAVRASGAADWYENSDLLWLTLQCEMLDR